MRGAERYCWGVVLGWMGLWLLAARATTPLASFVAEQAVVQSLDGQWLCSLDGEQWFEYTLPFVDTAGQQWWCKKTVRLTKPQLENYQWELWGLGAGYEVKCYVNGQYLGVHFGYWLPFRFRLPANILREGKNEVLLVVNGQLDPETTLPMQGIPYESAVSSGVFRSVYLIGRPPVAISELHYTVTPLEGKQGAQVNFQMVMQTGAQEHTDSLILRLSVARSPDSSIVAQTTVPLHLKPNREEQVTATVQIPQPTWWSPDHPYRYDMTIEVVRGGQVQARYRRKLGIRTLGIQGKQWRLNGEPWRWSGVDYVPFPTADGERQKERFHSLIRQAKMLGANIIRFRHFAPDLEFLQLCEEEGIFVTVEIPIAHVPTALLKEETLQNTVRYFARTLSQWYDASPAVFGWGIGEALPESAPETIAYQQWVAAFFHQISAKPVYKVIWWMASDTVQPGGVDFALIFTAWHSPEQRQRLANIAQRMPYPVVGYCGKIFQDGNHTGYTNPLSEEAQAKTVKEWMEFFLEHSAFQGFHIWALTDYRMAQPPALLPATFHPGVGLLDARGRQRLSFEVAKALVNGEQLPLIPAGRPLQQWDFVFPIAAGFALFLIFLLLNRSRRFQENFVRALTKSFNFYADVRDQRIIPWAHTLLLLIALSIGTGTFEAAIYYYLRFDYRFDWFVDIFFPQPLLKYTVAYILWRPVELIAVCAAGWILSFLGIALLARALAVFVESKIFFRDTLNVTTWSALPYLIAIVGGMGIYSGFGAGVPVSVAIWMLVGLTLWFFVRMMKGFAVVMDLWPPYVYTVAIAILVLLLTIWSVWYDLGWGFLSRLQYWLETM